MSLYDPGIEIAMIIKAPAWEKGRTCDRLISNVDFVPTVLDMLGLEKPRNLQGRSFWNLFSGKHFRPRAAVFAEKTYHTYYDPMRAVRTDRWKLIANFEFAPWQEVTPDYDNNAKSYIEIGKALALPIERQYHPPYELYDLEKDPWEQENLADDAACEPVRDDLIAILRSWMEETDDPLLQGPIAQGAYRLRMRKFKSIKNNLPGVALERGF
jgi:arylsulfatase A-like enzyme